MSADLEDQRHQEACPCQQCEGVICTKVISIDADAKELCGVARETGTGGGLAREIIAIKKRRGKNKTPPLPLTRADCASQEGGSEKRGSKPEATFQAPNLLFMW